MFYLMCVIIALLSIILHYTLENRKEGTRSNRPVYVYKKKSVMSSTEKEFYDKFKSILGDRYLIVPQVNLASIIKKENCYHTPNELFRNIDFGIYDKTTFELLLLIEINDDTHNAPHRKKRDLSVDNICNKAGYKLIKFWTHMPNEYSYIKNRLYEKISLNDIQL